MAKIITTIDFDGMTEEQVFDAFAKGKGYQDIILVKNFQIPNPETKAEFYHRSIGQYVQGNMHSGAIAEAIKTAAEAVPKPPVVIEGKPVEVQPVPVEIAKDEPIIDTPVDEPVNP